MSQRPYRGVFTIPVTPFGDDGALDIDGLKEGVEFCISAGAQGLVAPVNASEFSALSDAERFQVVETIARVNDGRIPYVAGANGVSTEVAVIFARHAADQGADAIIAMPPYVKKAHAGEVRRYYTHLSEVSDLPIFIQNHPIGVPMSAALLGQLVREIPNVLYIKEEIQPVTHSVTADIEACGDTVEGVFGGAAGRHMLDEFRRGAVGTMPACEVTDVHVAVWHAHESGDARKARELFNRLIPLLNFESLHGVYVYKEVMKRRGIIRSARVRVSDSKPLDAYDHAELDVILDDMKDMFIV